MPSGREVRVRGLEWLTPLVVFAPFTAVAAAAVLGPARQRATALVNVCVSALTLALVLPFYPGALAGEVARTRLVDVAPRLSISLRVDTLGFYFALLLALLWLLATIYSLGYMREGQARFHSFLALNLSFCLGVAFSANMFTLFIFYELMSLFTYPLIIHDGTERARRAGLKYLVYAISAGAVLLAAVIINYYYAGTLDFGAGGMLSAAGTSTGAMLTLFALYMLGFGVKASIMPLHGWVPDAHPAAPAPASALLSGVILKMGAFGMIRVLFDVFGMRSISRLGVALPMLWVASVTIIVASIFAITQDDLKRRLAYSSIAQVSYIILGLFFITQAGETGGLLQVAHHAVMKGTLFLCSGVILHETSRRNISEMAGIGRRLPVTMGAFSVAALGMIGMPLTCGFITKWQLGVGAMQAHRGYFIAILLASSLLNAVYFLPIIYTAFFREEAGARADGEAGALADDETRAPAGDRPPGAGDTAGGRNGGLPRFGREAPATMLVPLGITASLVVILGIFVTAPGLPYDIVKTIVGAVF